MGLISEVLAHGGFLPQLAELNKKKTIFNKKNGVVFSIFWMIVFMMLLPAIIGIFNGPGELQGLIRCPGNIWRDDDNYRFAHNASFFKAISADPGAHAESSASNGSGASRRWSASGLPPQQSIPASAYAPPRAGSWRDTKDLEPTSVTESTTKLLEKEDKI